MRAGLSTIQQTLTAEAASVLNHSIAEAGRRNHGQTTPLHVAATLLSSPTGFLRQACIKSHPNSSHPLQCRALELCFSVALERLPTAAAAAASAAGSATSDPPISNALMAALKRAQAHQRRGCPEQQQQPLLAVKVELEQLIISILDDPSVSRVMREASFSSPAVKATIEQTLTSTANTNSASTPTPTPPPLASSVGLGFRPGITVAPGGPARSLYANPRLHQNGGGGVGVSPVGGGTSDQPGQSRGEEVKRVVEIMTRGRKRNPVLVGDSEPEAVVREVLRRIEAKELAEGPMRSAEVVNLASTMMVGPAERVKEVAATVEARMGKPGVTAVILDLGDLKWLVEQPQTQPQAVSESGREAVVEVRKLLTRFGDRLWLIGTATCETYLRCKVYHPSMEIDWDLQVVPIAAKSPVPGLFPRLGTNGILSSSVESLSPTKACAAAKLGPPRLLSENNNASNPFRKTNRCPQCSQSYEMELAKITSEESEKSPSEVKPELNRPPLPLWLQNAKALDGVQAQAKSKEQSMALKLKTQELQKKWSDTCLQLHPSFHKAPSFVSERLTPKPISFNPNLLNRQPPSQPKLQMNKLLGGTLQLNTNLAPAPAKATSKLTISPPRSPIRTDLALGPQDQTHNDRVKDLIGCLPSEQPRLIEVQRDDKMASKLDADSFKRLSKGLAEKVWWQPEAAVSVAATMTECRLDSTRQRRGAASKGDMWILFLGPDRVAKRKMASALADLVSGSSPVVISLRSRRCDGDLDTSFRGKTVVDRIAEAVRRNPFSVVVLEDVNEADAIVRGNIKRAMERGRLADSHGREISLGNVVFVLTADWLPQNLKSLWSKVVSLDEEKLGSLARRPWELRLAISGKKAKRRAHWLSDRDGPTPTKPRNETNSNLFDLNEAAEADDNGSHVSSDLTEDECGLRSSNHPKTQGSLSAASPMSAPPPREVLEGVDDTIVFKPAELLAMRNGVMSTVSNRFSSVVGDGVPLEMDEDALEKIVGGLWLGKASLDEWTEDVLVPSFEQIKSTLPSSSTSEDSVLIRLESDGESNSREDLLPSSVKVVLTEA